MNTPSRTTHTLEIDGMTGDVCVQEVTAAIRSVPSVFVESVEVGSATIGADHAGCLAACTAIDKAGFKAHEAETDEDTPDVRTPDKKDAGRAYATSGAPTGGKSHARTTDDDTRRADRPAGAMPSKPAGVKH